MNTSNRKYSLIKSILSVSVVSCVSLCAWGQQASIPPASALNALAGSAAAANANVQNSSGLSGSQVLRLPSASSNNATLVAGYAPGGEASASSSSAPPASDAQTEAAAYQQASDQAFTKLTQNALPMSSEQIQKLRTLFADSQRAATAAPGGSPPKPVATTQLVSLEPGATPPVVRPSQGYVTSVMFLDQTGAPWPIQSYDIGNPGAFNIQWDRTSNIMLIQSTAMYTMTNMAVLLKGATTPLTVTLIPGQPVVDYRVDLRVQGLGPNAKPNVGNSLPQAASNDLVGILDGIPPNKSKILNVPGVNHTQAWLLGDRIYLRTHLTLLSPAWVASMSSADGTNVYEIPQTPSVLVADSDGKISTIRLEGY